MKKTMLTVVLLAILAATATADTLTVTINAAEEKALASITTRINTERATKFAEVVAQRKKYNDDINTKLSEVNATRDASLPKATPTDLGVALLPEVSAKDVSLGSVTPAEVLVALAGPALASEAKAAADSEAAAAAKEAKSVLDALKTLPDCSSKLTSVGLNPAKFCSTKK